jgi:hypothetical protein
MSPNSAGHRIFTLGLTVFIALIGYTACEPSVPEDLRSLLTIMAKNDMDAGQAACRKVNRKYGEAGLLQALKTGNGTARGRAARWLAIGHHGSHEAITALVQASYDPDDYVRIWSTYAIGELAGSSTFPEIKRLKNDKNQTVVYYAREAEQKINQRERADAPK